MKVSVFLMHLGFEVSKFKALISRNQGFQVSRTQGFRAMRFLGFKKSVFRV
jgi:hypothetical protein